MIYDLSGNSLPSKSISRDLFFQNMNLGYGFDSASSTNYTVIRVFKKRVDGSNQFPFVHQPMPVGSMTAYDLAVKEGWYLTINAGVGQGIVIENGTVITDEPAVRHAGALPLTIDENGDFGYVEADTAGKGDGYISNGIVSAVCGFYPIIVNYENFQYPDVPYTEELPEWFHAQRQIIGQFDNGDYAIITGEGRSFAGSVGFSIAEAQDLCKRLGLKFAYNLDGGGSTQTVLNKKNINHVYEGITGRKIKAYIVFNGANQYGIPLD